MSLSQIKRVFVVFTAAIALAATTTSSAYAQKYLGQFRGGSFRTQQGNFNYGNNRNYGYQNRQGNQRYGFQRQNNNFSGNYSNFNRKGYGTGHNFQHGSNGTRYGFQNRNRKGSNSGYGYRNNDSFGFGGSTMNNKGYGRDGSFSHGRNGTNVTYGQTSPGPFYGTQQRTWGSARFNGKNSQGQFGSDISVIGGGPRLGGLKSTIDRHGVTQRREGGIGGVKAYDQFDMRFKGQNSSARYERGARVGGAQAKGGVGVNRKGATGNASIGVGRHKVKANAKISTSGTRVKVGGLSVGF